MRNQLIILISAFLLFACSGEWTHYPVTQSETVEKTQVIDFGNKITVSVFEEANLSGDYDVLSNGTLMMPLIGSVDVQGLNLTNAAQVIGQKLIQSGYLINPKVTLAMAQPQTVKIMGEVIDTGEFPYSENLTILGLVAHASGFSYRADQNEFDIVRTQADGLERLIEGYISTRVKPGDIVRVRERYF